MQNVYLLTHRVQVLPFVYPALLHTLPPFPLAIPCQSNTTKAFAGSFSLIFIFFHSFFCLHLIDIGKIFSSWLYSWEIQHWPMQQSWWHFPPLITSQRWRWEINLHLNSIPTPLRCPELIFHHDLGMLCHRGGQSNRPILHSQGDCMKGDSSCSVQGSAEPTVKVFLSSLRLSVPPVPMDVVLLSGHGPVPGSDQWMGCSGRGGWKTVGARHCHLCGFFVFIYRVK